MKTRYSITAAVAALGSMLLLGTAVVAQTRSVPAELQQQELATDILGSDKERRDEAVHVAQGLGPSRMSDDLRAALISLLDQLNDLVDHVNATSGAVMSDYESPEFILKVQRTVAGMNDPRAIPVLANSSYGHNRVAAEGLASFGAQALPAILGAIGAPDASDKVVAYNLMALSHMVKSTPRASLPVAARNDIARVARDSLRRSDGPVLLMATELAVALGEPDLVQAVRELSVDSGLLRARGVDQITADIVKKHASDTLSKASPSEQR